MCFGEVVWVNVLYLDKFNSQCREILTQFGDYAVLPKHRFPPDNSLLVPSKMQVNKREMMDQLTWSVTSLRWYACGACDLLLKVHVAQASAKCALCCASWQLHLARELEWCRLEKKFTHNIMYYSNTLSLSVQCAVCSVQCAVCSVQCAVCSVQCAVCNVWCMWCGVCARVVSVMRYWESWLVRRFVRCDVCVVCVCGVCVWCVCVV